MGLSQTLSTTTENVEKDDPKVTHAITVIEILVLAIAVFGNSMMLILMQEKRLKQYSFSVYFTFAAIFDTCTIFWNCLEDAYELNHDAMLEENASRSYTFSCGILQVFDDWFPSTSAWLVVAVCVDRYISVCHQSAAQTFCRRKVAFLVCFVLIVCTFIFELPWWLIFPDQDDLHTKNDPVLCGDESYGNVKGIELAENIVQLLIPVTIMTVLNIRVLITLKRNKAFRTETRLTDVGRQQHRVDVYNLTIFYLLIFTILSWLPWMIVNMIERVYFEYMEQKANTPFHVNLGYAWHITLVLWLFTFAQNFYVLLIMSPIYRIAMKRQCACLPCFQTVQFERFDVDTGEPRDEQESMEMSKETYDSMGPARRDSITKDML